MYPVMIRAPHENEAEVYRAGAEEWNGETISALGQLLEYI
jgi:hypothetical protein